MKNEKVLWIRHRGEPQETALGLNFSDQPATLPFPGSPGRWDRLVDSAEARWRGPGSLAPKVLQVEGDLAVTLAPHSLLLFVLTKEDA